MKANASAAVNTTDVLEDVFKQPVPNESLNLVQRKLPVLVYIGCALSILLVLAVGCVAILFSNRQKQMGEWVKHTYTIIANVEAIHHYIIDMATAKRGYRSTRDSLFMNNYLIKTAPLTIKLDSLSLLVKENPTQVALAGKLSHNVNDLLRFWQVEDSRQGSINNRNRILNITLLEKKKLDVLRSNIEAFITNEHKLLARREVSNQQLRQNADIATVTGTAIILILVSLLIYFIIKELKYRFLAYKTVVEVNNLRSGFVSMASHEFRTPLSSILLSISLIEKYSFKQDPEAVLKHTSKIKTTIGFLTGILDDFLSLEKINQGNMKADLQLFDVVEFCDDITKDLETSIKPNQHIYCQHKGAGRIVKLDKNLLRNSIINLISNSIKYAGDDTLIILQTEVWADHVNVSVIDNGAGISPQDQKRLFSPFFRINANGSIPGTGLGLNLVLRYVQLMKGNLSYYSIPKQETCFKMTFPVMPIDHHQIKHQKVQV